MSYIYIIIYIYIRKIGIFQANKKNKQKTPMHACMHFYISIPNNL